MCRRWPASWPKRLLDFVPYLDKVFFANSGTEATEAAIKFARRATGRPGIVYCDHAFHGLTNGALSLNGDAMFRDGFEPLAAALPRGAFQRSRRARTGAGNARRRRPSSSSRSRARASTCPTDDYLREAAALCRKYGTLFVADEIQTGLGRTGRFLAVEHWGVEPDMVLLAKALSGGHVPVGAVLMRKWIFDKLFDRMDRAVVHGSTFAKNDLAMAAGLATLEVMQHERVVAQGRSAAAPGCAAPSTRMAERYELVQRHARQGTDDRHRVRPTQIAQAQGGLERARNGQ